MRTSHALNSITDHITSDETVPLTERLSNAKWETQAISLPLRLDSYSDSPALLRYIRVRPQLGTTAIPSWRRRELRRCRLGSGPRPVVERDAFNRAFPCP